MQTISICSLNNTETHYSTDIQRIFGNLIWVQEKSRNSSENKKKAPKTMCFRCFFGGDKRDRTADLLNAIQALSQLSYTPKFSCAVRQLLYYSTDSENVKGDFLIF